MFILHEISQSMIIVITAKRKAIILTNLHVSNMKKILVQY